MFKKCVLVWCAALLSMFLVSRVHAQVTVPCQVSFGPVQPAGLALDTVHQSVWVTMFHGNQVFELSASNCSTMRVINTGINPLGVAFDGTNVWVANYGSNTVMKINAGTGAVVGTFPVGANPRGVTFDGNNIWVANYSSNTVTRINVIGGSTATFPVGSGPYFLTFSPTDNRIYVPNVNGNTVTVLDPVSGAQVRTIITDSQSVYMTPGRAGTVWVSCYNSQKVDEISTSNGAIILRATPPHSGPTGIAYDPAAGFLYGVTNSGYFYAVDEAGTVRFSVFRGGGNHAQYDIVLDNINIPASLFTTDIGSGFVAKLNP